ncbi:MAG: hypothetical protein J7K40_14440 [candidate division Zixibacteria bacterium]|nr:hypothetical protein [candidate division Zixibacteria bacterium]
MKQKNVKILIAAHDAGGAELLSSMTAAELGNYKWQVVARDDSPANSIFIKKGMLRLIAQPEKSAASAFESFEPDILFCGTSLNKYELPYIKEAKKRDVCSISFLDHWVNYQERFDFPNTGWKEYLPDFTAVSDSYAFQIADSLKVFNLLKIKNYYIEKILTQHDDITAVSTDSKILLFISEAIEEHRADLKQDDPLQLGYTQTDVIEDVLNNFKLISGKLDVERVVIRLHPAEALGKYDYLQQRYPEIISVVEHPKKRPLNESIRNARCVIGINSMALMIAHLLGKRVVSYIPADQKCVLPLPPECCVHSLKDMKGIKSIPCWNHHSRLSFYEEYNLSKMLNGLKEINNESCSHN